MFGQSLAYAARHGPSKGAIFEPDRAARSQQEQCRPMASVSELSVEKTLIGAGTETFANGDRERLHVHAEQGQLKWPSTGIASVRTPGGIFVASSRHAVWIPPGVQHGGMYSDTVFEQNLYVEAQHAARLPGQCCLVEVPARVAVAIADAVASRTGYQRPSRSADEAVLAMLERELQDLGRLPLVLKLPERSVLQPVFDSLLEHPPQARPSSSWAKQLSMADRSFRRAFVREAGLSFGEWSKRARALYALKRLSTGADVAGIADELGYASTSAFVFMFRTLLRVTPARYYRGSDAAER